MEDNNSPSCSSSELSDRSLEHVMHSIHNLEEEVARDSQNAVAVTHLANELLVASKLLARLGQAHESSLMQGRAADTYGRAAELNSAILRSHAIDAALCTFQIPPSESPGFRVIEEDDDDPLMEESSSEEDFDHAEHFYELAKGQYKMELSKHPENERMRRRYDELKREHGDGAGPRKARRRGDV